MEEPQYRRFFYKGRYIQSITRSDGLIAFGYETSESEYKRIEKKYEEQSLPVPAGRGKNNEPVVLIGFYELQNIRNGYTKPTFLTTIYEPVTLGGITNSDLLKEIPNDSSFFTNATGQPSPNTGNPNQPGPEGGSTPVSEPNNPAPQETGILKYPLDMRGDQDRIMFEAYEYKSGSKYESRLGGGGFGELSPVTYINPQGKVFLSIQSSITDQNSVGWESDIMNPIEVEVAKLSRRLMTSTPGNITKKVGAFFTEILQESKKNQEAVRTYLVSQALGVNSLQSRLTGQVLNPNMELLFQGPQLRPFNFTFKLSAREPAEGTRIKKIIRYFKQNMAVKKDNALFLRAPNVFKIQYQYGNGNPHKSLNLIKMCALTNCSVDYTPLGSYMTYDDKEHTMVAYTLSLAFQELTPIYDDDYKEFKYGEGESIKVPSENSIGP